MGLWGSKPSVTRLSCFSDFHWRIDLALEEFIKICTQPQTEAERKKICLDFYDKLRNSDVHYFYVACMFVSDYVYRNLSASLPAISKVLFAYYKNYRFIESDFTSRKFQMEFFEELYSFNNIFKYEKCEEMLVALTLDCIIEGDIGLASFLIKFGIVKFPYNAITSNRIWISEKYLM